MVAVFRKIDSVLNCISFFQQLSFMSEKIRSSVIFLSQVESQPGGLLQSSGTDSKSILFTFAFASI